MQLNQKVLQPQLVEVVQNTSTEVNCHHCGSKDYRKKGKLDERQKYQCKNCGRVFVENPQHRYRSGSIDPDDIWYFDDLGIELLKSVRKKSFAFHRIQQEWLKVVAKKYVSYRMSTKSPATALNDLQSIIRFSDFLTQRHLGLSAVQMSRSIVVDYVVWLSSKRLSASRHNESLSVVKELFETIFRENWLDTVRGIDIVYQEDFVKRPASLPRYIPEEVVCQLNQYLDALPEPVQRMVLVIQECGMRVSELCELPLDCLKQDSQGNFSIQFMRWKMKKEDALPVSKELAKVIQEQQHYIREKFGDSFDYLFCARHSSEHSKFIPKPKVMSSASFAKFLKDLADQFDIRDSSGKKWNFQTHQFRHTVGTRMINNGVPQHIIQRYLGHDSATMTQVYARIHDKTLRKEIEKYHETRVVDIAGNVIELEQSVLRSDEDLEWFKKNVLAMAVPYGYCGKPKVLGTCTLPPNSCLNCAHLRTNKNFLPVFKDELKRTNEILAKARQYAWEVQIGMNEPIKENCEKIIKALEDEVS